MTSLATLFCRQIKRLVVKLNIEMTVVQQAYDKNAVPIRWHSWVCAFWPEHIRATTNMCQCSGPNAKVDRLLRQSWCQEADSPVFDFTIWWYGMRTRLVSCVPKPGKSVTLISNMHHENAFEGKTSTDGALKRYQEWREQHVPRRATMFTSRRTTNRWPLVVFCSSTRLKRN